jgi:fucose 4-O-acetylase-like acetyltransferase
MANEVYSAENFSPGVDGLGASKSESAAERIAWLDAARGIGIILVVTFHAVGGMLQAGLLSRDGIFGDAFYIVYTFHMPLFFYLSGLLLKDRLQKSPKLLVTSSVKRLLYPYFLWGYIQVLVIFSLGKFVNTPISLGWLDLISPLWSPPSQFWFLYVLFFLQLIAVVSLTLWNDFVLLGMAVLFRIAVSIFVFPDVLASIGLFDIFFVAGVFTGPRMKNWANAIRFPGMVSILLFALTIFLAAENLRSGVWYWSAYTLPAGILGTLAVLTLSAVPQVGSNPLLGLLGRRALTIFLAHVLCVAGTRIVLVKLLHIEAIAIVLPLAVLAGLIVPVLFYNLCAKWKLRGIFGLS